MGPADEFTVATEGATTASDAAWDCIFNTKGDYVHISSSSPTRAAHGHGWWSEVTPCPPGTQAIVTGFCGRAPSPVRGR